MKYIITTGDAKGRAHHWFAMFLAFGCDWDKDESYNIQQFLDKHNSNATILSPDDFCIGDNIEFRSEADFLIFKLKWS